MRVVIPIEPATKKNSPRIVRAGAFAKVLPSERFTAYQNACAQYLLPVRPEKPVNERVEVVCLFYRKTKRRVDLTNLLEAVDDVLVYYGILADDNANIIASHDGSRVHLDREHPRTEITIRPLREEDDSMGL